MKRYEILEQSRVAVVISKWCVGFVTDVVEYMKYLKLAVAVAVIRSRPGGMTGQQYAQQLCARYQQTQLGWKHEAHRLKQQLSVVLQQKPLLGRLVNTRVVHSTMAKKIKFKLWSRVASSRVPLNIVLSWQNFSFLFHLKSSAQWSLSLKYAHSIVFA